MRLASYSWKDNSTGLGDSYLVQLNRSERLLIIDFSCLSFRSMEILVANIVESMKWSDIKQLAAYTLVRSIALVPSLALLTVFAVQSLLAYLLCTLASTEEESHWVMIVSGWLKSNFKPANVNNITVNTCQLMNYSRKKSRQSLLEAVDVIGFPYNVFPN